MCIYQFRICHFCFLDLLNRDQLVQFVVIRDHFFFVQVLSTFHYAMKIDQIHFSPV